MYGRVSQQSATRRAALCQGQKPWSADASPKTGTVWVSTAAPEKSMRTASTPDTMECLSSPRRNGLRSGCPSRHLKQSMWTASAPDKWNVSHRPVVYGHQFMSCRVLELSIKSYVRSSLGRRNLSHVAIHVSRDSLLVFGSVGCWKHCGWSSEIATPSRFLRVGFV